MIKSVFQSSHKKKPSKVVPLPKSLRGLSVLLGISSLPLKQGDYYISATCDVVMLSLIIERIHKFLET